MPPIFALTLMLWRPCSSTHTHTHTYAHTYCLTPLFCRRVFYHEHPDWGIVSRASRGLFSSVMRLKRDAGGCARVGCIPFSQRHFSHIRSNYGNHHDVEAKTGQLADEHGAPTISWMQVPSLLLLFVFVWHWATRLTIDACRRMRTYRHSTPP